MSESSGGSSIRPIYAYIVCALLGGCVGATIAALTLGSLQATQTHVWHANMDPGSLDQQQQPLAKGDPLKQVQPGKDASSAERRVKMPAKFSHLDVNQPLAAEVEPTSLAAKFPGNPPQDADAFQFHWVISSCERHHWGRMITHTLLSGLFNGLKPTTISIVWCKPYAEGTYPALLRNLRHSHSVNVFFLNPKLVNNSQVNQVEASLMTALMVPKALGMPDLPVLIMEDDVMVAPDANLRLARAFNQIDESRRSLPVMIKCYTGGEIKPAPDKEEGIEQHADDLGDAQASFDIEGVKISEGIGFGSQANFFTGPMAALILYEMLEFVKPGATHQGHFQDMAIMAIMEARACNKQGADCFYYTMSPSLVQHIGTSSTLFGAFNQRMHLDPDFPIRTSFPGYDADGMWRRRQRQRHRRSLR